MDNRTKPDAVKCNAIECVRASRKARMRKSNKSNVLSRGRWSAKAMGLLYLLLSLLRGPSLRSTNMRL